MEVISGVASAFAVVSLSVQLLDKIHEFCEFWGKVKDAPHFILDLVQELRLLEAVLEEIRLKEQQHGPDATLTSILQRVSIQVGDLLALTAKYQPGLSSNGRISRTWRSFKFSLKGDQIKQFRLSLSETKATLVLARFNLSEKSHCQLHEQTLIALTEGFTNLNVRRASGAVSTINEDPLDLQGHIDSLKDEMRRVTAGVPQSWIQSGMQAAINEAVQGMARTLIAKDTDPLTRPVVTAVDRGREHSSRGLDPDLESARKSVRTESERRARKLRYLGPDYFHGSYASITSSMFGTIYLNTSKFYVEDSSLADGDDRNDRSLLVEIETQFTFYPARWLMWWGLRYGFHAILTREGASWRNSLQTFHAVPDNALIFEFCNQGNILAVNTLLANGQASPWDTNSKGWTPLHVAAWHCNIPLMKALIRAGSDKKALTFDFPSGNYEHCSPLVTAATIASTIHTSSQQRIEALRVFFNDLDFSDHEGQAWKMVLVILERERASTGLCTTTAVSEWVLDSFVEDLRANHSPQLVAWLLTFTMETPHLLRRILDLSGNQVDASVVEGGYTPLHGKIAENFSDSIVPGIKELLVRGFDPHHVGMTSSSYGGDDSERLDTPTSLALRRSSFFHKWRELIRKAGYNMEDFVREELEHSPLIASGWTIPTLTQIFNLHYEPLELDPDLCYQCGRMVYHTFDKDESWWEDLLRSIRGDSASIGSDLKSPNLSPLPKVEDTEHAFNQVNFLNINEGSLSSDSPTSPISRASTSSDETVDLCWKCGIMKRVYGINYERGRL